MLQEKVEELKELEAKLHAYDHASNVLYVDGTTVAPSDSFEGRGETLAVLAEARYNLLINEDTQQVLEDLDAEQDRLDPQTAREVYLLRREYRRERRVPVEFYAAYSKLVNDASSVWHKAKLTNDFALFSPYLQKLLDYNRKLAYYYNSAKDPYDVMLDLYEEGLTRETVDSYFAQVRETVVPLLAKVVAAPQIDCAFLDQKFPLDKQRELSDYLMEVLGLDREHCTIGETEHPYTCGFNKKDVRITTHYLENNFVSSMYSVIHESGHALYERHIADSMWNTCLSTGASMSIHESQSRFYENYVGRSEAFVSFLFPKLRELFPKQLRSVTPHKLYLAVNRGEPGLIRTEADELTYSLHIMIRYELEKKLFAGELEVKDVPAAWNALYKEYLGLDVPTDTQGCLQDSHWSGGSFGYFPSYSLGNAYGAQLLAAMGKEINIEAEISRGNLAAITRWLTAHIHQYGALYDPAELLEKACGEPFDPKYYTDYLTKKYTEIYKL